MKMIFDVLKRIIGITLVALGIIGLFLPIVQGVLLIIAGLLILGIKKEEIKRWLKNLKF